MSSQLIVVDLTFLGGWQFYGLTRESPELIMAHVTETHRLFAIDQFNYHREHSDWPDLLMVILWDKVHKAPLKEGELSPYHERDQAITLLMKQYEDAVEGYCNQINHYDDNTVCKFKSRSDNLIVPLTLDWMRVPLAPRAIIV
jgi:hypothetical protein